mmetsp:Transcript_14869/g.21276  ORF Transcript_14869/g.21276 Transcript_14869/m.21276 type:complete len:212 (+) Transcript_14869:129-764(+)
MTSVVELFPKNRKLAYDARQQLSQVQNGVLHPSELYLSLDEIGRQLDIMESLVSHEAPAQREVWRRKILELREDAASLRRQGEYYHRMVSANARQMKNREEILTRRRTARRNTNGDAESALNDLTDESQSVSNSQMMVGELLMSGQAQLNSLVKQRQSMRGIKRMVLNIGTKIGLSTSTMRMIERRDITDAYLVFGGICTTLVVMYFCWLR